tara:strand:- start:757 stop:1353 length:597 start_codon:yes stop_codon:yes gene_type:complete
MLEVKYEESGGGGQWENAPAGIHKATCCDLVDLGMQDDNYNPGVKKHQIEIVFELDRETAGIVEATGNPFTVRTQRLNLPAQGKPLHEKSSLYKVLSGWRGGPIKSGENIPLEKLIGKPVHLVLQKAIAEGSGNEYTKIASYSPKRKNELFPPLSGSYIRRKDREGYEPQAAPQPVQPASQATAPVAADNLDDDDVPF